MHRAHFGNHFDRNPVHTDSNTEQSARVQENEIQARPTSRKIDLVKQNNFPSKFS